eukprot:gene4541-8565_t
MGQLNGDHPKSAIDATVLTEISHKVENEIEGKSYYLSFPVIITEAEVCNKIAHYHKYKKNTFQSPDCWLLLLLQFEWLYVVESKFNFSPALMCIMVLYGSPVSGDIILIDSDCTNPIDSVSMVDKTVRFFVRENSNFSSPEQGSPPSYDNMGYDTVQNKNVGMELDVLGSNKRSINEIDDSKALPDTLGTNHTKVQRMIGVGVDELDSDDDDISDKSLQTCFVGLANQGATCYLNSLLQSLYMTPEFRNAVYRSEAQSQDETSIPAELQKLFLRLQTSKQRAVDTKDITKSFGWDTSEAFQQHDVQELLRVLFDALEEEWCETPLNKTIQELYEGEMLDYVKCTECNYESARTDKFMDIPLVIKPFGSNREMKNVEEAMTKFIEVEKMEGDNQYHCERCNKKVDALKGLKFKSFPYILTLQLKRFDFDYVTLRRIKLNSRFEFPLELDVTPYLSSDAEHNNNDERDTKSFHHCPSQLQERREAAIAKGCLYELFSVLIHRGSALGGHYYAYIKSLDDGIWRCFNDSSVTEIKEKDIAEAYGGVYGGYAWSSTSGYMLMYRRIDPHSNAKFTTVNDLPKHLRDLAANAVEHEERENERRAREARIISFSVWKDDGTKFSIRIDKTEKLSDLLTAALKEAKKDPNDRSKYRICRYDSYRKRRLQALSDLDKQLDDIGYYSNYNVFNIALQEANSDGGFDEYDPDSMELFMRVFDIETESFGDSFKVVVPLRSEVQHLKDAVIKSVNGDINKLTLLTKSYSYPRVLLEGSLSKFYLNNGDRVYATFEEISSRGYPERTVNAIDLLNSLLTLTIHVPEDIVPGGKDHQVQVSKVMKLYELKDKYIRPLLGGLPCESFQLHRKRSYYYADDMIELTRLEDSLESNYLDVQNEVFVCKGKALKPGETNVTIYLLDDTEEDLPELFSDFPANSNSTGLQFLQ